jgi:putative nucleotidyltransferase with HDIG domain
MSEMLNKKEILDSIQANIQDKDMVKHMLAVEAIMRSMAKRLGEDEDEWGFTGLVHDIDVELVEDEPSSHSKLGADIARDLGASEEMACAILCHNVAHGIPRKTKLDKALFCADALDGIITASAMARPDGLNGLTARSVVKHFHEKGFADGVNREQVAECQQIGLELEEFIVLGLKAMKGIASRLEL